MGGYTNEKHSFYEKDCGFTSFVAISIGFVMESRVVKAEKSFVFSELEDEVLGGSDMSHETRLPNWMTVNWKATADKIMIYVTNTGLDAVDQFKGNVRVTNGETVAFSTYSIKAFETRTIVVYCSMKKCYEDINVDYYAIDGGDQFGSGISHGHREIPTYLLALGLRGTFSTPYDSINYHFDKHGLQIAALDIVTYASAAARYQYTVMTDVATLSQQQLNNKYTIVISFGATMAKKYKNKITKEYAILADGTFKILSFGK